MNKLVLSLLTTVAFSAPTFGSKSINPDDEALSDPINHAKQGYRVQTQETMLTKISSLLTGTTNDFSASVVGYFGSPLSYAIQNGLFETAKALLKTGAPATESRVGIVNPLTAAAELFTLDQFQKFFAIAKEQGVDINYVDANNISVLNSAIKRAAIAKDASTAVWLLESGATIAESDLRLALCYSGHYSHSFIATLRTKIEERLNAQNGLGIKDSSTYKNLAKAIVAVADADADADAIILAPGGGMKNTPESDAMLAAANAVIENRTIARAEGIPLTQARLRAKKELEIEDSATSQALAKALSLLEAKANNI